jgi:hypothetical protein
MKTLKDERRIISKKDVVAPLRRVIKFLTFSLLTR